MNTEQLKKEFQILKNKRLGAMYFFNEVNKLLDKYFLPNNLKAHVLPKTVAVGYTRGKLDIDYDFTLEVNTNLLTNNKQLILPVAERVKLHQLLDVLPDVILKNTLCFLELHK